jgi:hypothetical protein
MPEPAQERSANAHQRSIRHAASFMEAYPYLVKITGIISMEDAQKQPEKDLKK